MERYHAPRNPREERSRTARAALALAVLAAAAPARPAPPPTPADDPVLARLVEESLAARPELASAEAAARAELERVSQASALPDPVLSLGIQNDGFEEIMIGEMEQSYWEVMLSQGLPWPGKRGFRADVARLAADEARTAVERVRLGTEADVRRGWLDLLLARGRLELIGRLEAVWKRSAELARTRYETGEGAQSDLLRAQLEMNRLKQRRWAVEADARTAQERLNRLRGKPLDAPIATEASLRDAPVPAPLSPEDALADALARSPELRRARLGAARAGAAARLASRERFPDMNLQASYMGRGSLVPMWSAQLSVPIPIWTGRKQGAAAAEGAQRAVAETRTAEGIEQVLRLRVSERAAVFGALADSVRLYREGLLVLSRATLDSTLSQYSVGRVTFASVLEASAGYLADEEGHLSTVADALRVAVAAREVSLEAAGGSGGGLGGGAGVPGAGAMASGGAGGPAAGAGSRSAGAGAPPSGAGMGGGM